MPQHQDAVQFRTAGDRAEIHASALQFVRKLSGFNSRPRPMPTRSTAPFPKSRRPPAGCWRRCIPMRRRATARSRPRRQGSGRGCGSDSSGTSGSNDVNAGSAVRARAAPPRLLLVFAPLLLFLVLASIVVVVLRVVGGVVEFDSVAACASPFGSCAFGGFELAHPAVILPGIEHHLQPWDDLLDRRQWAGRTGFAARTGARAGFPRSGFALPEPASPALALGAGFALRTGFAALALGAGFSLGGPALPRGPSAPGRPGCPCGPGRPGSPGLPRRPCGPCRPCRVELSSANGMLRWIIASVFIRRSMTVSITQAALCTGSTVSIPPHRQIEQPAKRPAADPHRLGGSSRKPFSRAKMPGRATSATMAREAKAPAQ